MNTPYRDVAVYYESGTGNSYRAGCWLAEAGQERQIDARTVPVDSAPKPDVAALGPDHLFVLTFPTHGFTAPWSVVRFAWRLPRGRDTHAAVVATRGGVKIGRVFLPGMEGTAGYLIALMLLLRGYQVRGVLGLDMPVSWLALHPGYSEHSARAIAARSRPRLTRFAANVLDGRPDFGRGSLICLALGLLLGPISLAYLLRGRKMLAKLFFASDQCNGCGVCADNCPRQAIRMLREAGGRHRPYWTYSCESCQRCVAFCPNKAVEASHPFAAGMFYLAAVPAGAYAIGQLAKRVPALRSPRARLLEWPLQHVYALTAGWLAYWLFTLALRVPALNRVFTVGTPTHYYRRYHDPDTRLADIRRR